MGVEGGLSPTPDASRSGELKERARALGFSLVGITDPAPSPHIPFLRSWLDRGYHGAMAYLANENSIARRGNPALTLEDVRSVVVVAHEYNQPDPDGAPEDPSRAVIARYARGRDYHKVVGNKLRQLARWLDEGEGQVTPSRTDTYRGKSETPNVSKVADGRTKEGSIKHGRTVTYVDSGPVLERDLARRAGLGWFGKNTMLIHPRRGSYFFLGVLLTTVELERDRPFDSDHCGTCSRCLEACPTGALLGYDDIGAPVIDARRCISYLTIEQKGPIPEALRPLIGNRIFGCDICQEVCPWNERFGEFAVEPGYAARGAGESPAGVEPEGRGPQAGIPGAARTTAEHPGTNAPPLIDLLATVLDAGRWEDFSRGSAIRRAGRAGFARNLCVGLGNWGSPEAVPVLASALSDREPLVRGHAAWALGRVGSAEAREALRSRAPAEPDEWVRSELSAALGQ